MTDPDPSVPGTEPGPDASAADVSGAGEQPGGEGPGTGAPGVRGSGAGGAGAGVPGAGEQPGGGAPGVGMPGAREPGAADPGGGAPGRGGSGGDVPRAGAPDGASAPLRIVLADDQTLVRAAFAMLIASAPGMAVVGEAGTGREAVALARSQRADLVVMDIRMPDLDGIEATRLIAADEDLGHVRVLVLTTYDTDDHVVEALRAGASGFLVKDTRPAELLEAIRTVAAGESLLSPGPTARLIARVLRAPAPDADGESAPGSPGSLSALSVLGVLSAREREVLTLVARGLNNAEIARSLALSPLTAKTHVSRIMGKLSVRDRAQLVITAYESGLVTPGAVPPGPA